MGRARGDGAGGAAPLARARRRLLLGVLVVATAGLGADVAGTGARGSAAAAPARRVISLNPSLTEILIALGAAEVLVGVDDYSTRVRPEVAELPTVGGLFNPSLEAVVALEPDLVVLVPGAQQRDFGRRLEGLGVEVLSLPNVTLEEVLASIETLGARVARGTLARRRISEIRAAFAAAERAAADRPHPRAVLVLQRDPLFVVGRGSFLDAMLKAAGAENLGAGLSQPYPRAGIEWLIAEAPEVILDASDDPQPPGPHWARWPSLPAVAAGRVVAIPTSEVIRPGPYLDRGLARLVAALAPPP